MNITWTENFANAEHAELVAITMTIAANAASEAKHTWRVAEPAPAAKPAQAALAAHPAHAPQPLQVAQAAHVAHGARATPYASDALEAPARLAPVRMRLPRDPSAERITSSGEPSPTMGKPHIFLYDFMSASSN